jgi:hypothetical protein
MRLMRLQPQESLIEKVSLPALPLAKTDSASQLEEANLAEEVSNLDFAQRV